MSITVKPTHPDLHPQFAAEISGIDLARPLKAADRYAIEDAINRYAVVVFHDQKLTDEQQIDFAGHFGPIHASAQRARHHSLKHRLARDEIADISNLDGDSKVMEVDHRRRLDWLANRLWHTDASFRAVPGALSMLYAHVVPAEGGDTEFADLRAAYDALPEAKKKEIEGLVAEHSIWHSRGQLSVTKFSEAELASLPPVPQRVVRTHPGSKRKTLYIAAHASHIIGMPIPDGRLILLDLIEHATQPKFVHAHTWREGDLVIWDNRCTMHRARPFDTTQVRDLRRVTTRDVASTLEQAA
jgi:alpha-ketoglutarate-dependent 2,4-dichlorophenoxyacetate dioxygenase